jgi:kynurenine formamidase
MNPTFLNHPISEDTPSYGNRDKIILKPGTQISKGDTANTTEIFFTNNHIGTHVDVPKHFYDNGRTITDLKASEWFFDNISLIDIPCEEGRLIHEEDLKSQQISSLTDFLIIRTGYESLRSDESYWNAYPGISPEACSYLRENFSKLRAVGFDFISLTSPLFKEEGKEAHRILLRETDGDFILIIEDMKLAHLSEAPGKSIISPLMIQNGNGGPVTIFAF